MKLGGPWELREGLSICGWRTKVNSKDRLCLPLDQVLTQHKSRHISKRQQFHPLWLPQALNQALRQQCTFAGYVRSEQWARFISNQHLCTSFWYSSNWNGPTCTPLIRKSVWVKTRWKQSLTVLFSFTLSPSLELFDNGGYIKYGHSYCPLLYFLKSLKWK